MLLASVRDPENTSKADAIARSAILFIPVASDQKGLWVCIFLLWPHAKAKNTHHAAKVTMLPITLDQSAKGSLQDLPLQAKNLSLSRSTSPY
jgi:hypothetical protein